MARPGVTEIHQKCNKNPYKIRYAESDAKSMQKASKTEARIHEKSMKNMMRLRTGPRDAPIGPEWAEPPPEGDPGEAGPGHRGARARPSGCTRAPLPWTPVADYIHIELARAMRALVLSSHLPSSCICFHTARRKISENIAYSIKSS